MLYNAQSSSWGPEDGQYRPKYVVLHLRIACMIIVVFDGYFHKIYYSFFSLPRRRIWLLAHIAIPFAFTLKQLLFFLWIYFNSLKTGLHTHETRHTRRNMPWFWRTFLALYYLNIPKRTDSDRGVRSWPWQWFVLGKAEHPLFLNSNQRITVKNTFGWNAVMFFACEVILSTFCNVLCGWSSS